MISILRKRILNRFPWLRGVREFQRFLFFLGFRESFRFLGAYFTNQPEVSLKISGCGSPLVCRPRDSDRKVLRAIFGERELYLDSISPSNIVDLGANVGYASVYYALQYPEAKIVAVEMEPNNLLLLRKNGAPYRTIQIVESPIWNRPELLEVVHASEAWAFHVRRATEDSCSSIRATTIPELMESYGMESIDILKVDIEGAETVLFADNYDLWIDRVRVICIETHGAAALEVVRSALDGRPFDCHRCGEKLVFIRKMGR